MRPIRARIGLGYEQECGGRQGVYITVDDDETRKHILELHLSFEDAGRLLGANHAIKCDGTLYNEGETGGLT